MNAEPDSSAGPRRRRKGVRSRSRCCRSCSAPGHWAGLFGIGIVIGWFDNDEGGIHRVHELGFGVLYGIVVATAFFALIRRPASKPSVYLQVIVVALAVAVAALVSADAAYLAISGVLLIASAILFALLPDREGILHSRPDLSPVLAVFTLLAAIPSCRSV